MMKKPVTLKAVCEACRLGSVSKLSAWKSENRLPILMLQYNSHTPHEFAARYGQLAVLRWLVEESGQSIDVTANENTALSYAAKYNHLDVLKWLVKDSKQLVDVSCRYEEPLRSAASNGHLAVVRWLIEDSGSSVNVSALGDAALRWALERMHASIALYLVCSSGAYSRADQLALDDFESQDLRWIAGYCFGIDTAGLHHRQELLTVLAVAVVQPSIASLHELLTKLGFPETLDSRQKYLISPSCQQAAYHLKLQTLEDLEKLVNGRFQSSRSTKL